MWFRIPDSGAGSVTCLCENINTLSDCKIGKEFRGILRDYEFLKKRVYLVWDISVSKAILCWLNRRFLSPSG